MLFSSEEEPVFGIGIFLCVLPLAFCLLELLSDKRGNKKKKQDHILVAHFAHSARVGKNVVSPVLSRVAFATEYG